MKNSIFVLSLTIALVATFAFAGEVEDTTDAEEVIASECFVDKDGDGVCDTCDKTADECAADLEAGKCETCTKCCDETEKDEKDDNVKPNK